MITCLLSNPLLQWHLGLTTEKLMSILNDDKPKHYQVLVIGYGEMGHAIEYLLTQRNHSLDHTISIDLWDRIAVGNSRFTNLKEAIPKADFVFFCMPVSAYRQTAELVRPFLKDNAISIAIAKGIDEQGEIASQIFSTVLANKNQAFLYGPMIAENLYSGRYGFAQVATQDENVYDEIHALFTGSNLYIEHSKDVIGANWAVVLKNVYAILFGITDELNYGDNVRGYLMVMCVRELCQIVQHMGGDSDTPLYLAGLGDLITTSTSQDSHHYQLGQKLARGETEVIDGEGPHTLAMVDKFKILDYSQFSVFTLASQIIKSPNNLKQLLENHFDSLLSS
jgi:glycerol-3-phosphate dehydrogenase (NAD(P)+)